MRFPGSRGPVFRGQATRAILAITLIIFFAPSSISATQRKLASTADYHRYIEALLDVKDFGTNYSEDGAADATVVFPGRGLRPAEPIVALLGLKGGALPLLIDCLSDMRITSVRFDGNSMTRPMNVPLGYVCLDILMNLAGGPVFYPNCADDGLGACVNYNLYFRPDDYDGCSKQECLLRPWIIVVQRAWRRLYLAHKLKFHDPYEHSPEEQYKDLRSPPK